MLKKILSISGKPGLYRLVSYGKNMLIVENLADKRRMPAYARDKVISLGDIAIYTNAEEVPLAKVFENIRVKYEGKQLDTTQLKTAEQLRTFFADVLPDYDEERVHNGDIKKVVSWYNLLIADGVEDFTPQEEAEEKDEAGKE